MASLLLNGERAVVLLFIAPILHATPLSLLPEALSLSLLALFALVIEVFADSSPNSQLAQFKTRRGASSGILLGAVTLPCLMISRLIQLSRALSLHEIGVQGWSAALKLLWVLSQGLATVKLIQHVVHNFPFCASIGEALLVTGGLVTYFGDMFALTFVKIHGYLSQSELTYVQYGIKRSEISIIIQVWLFPCEGRIPEKGAYSNGRAYHEIGKSVMFYASLASVLIVIVPLWMQIVQTFHVHPLLWVIDFVVSEPLKRLSLCIYWVAVILVSVRRFYNISKNSKIERILLRKYYHLMAVLMFLPALIFQPKFLDLAFGAALAVFLVLEIIRVWRIWPLGQLVHQFMNAFTDHRDSDLLIVRHQWLATSMVSSGGAKQAVSVVSSIGWVFLPLKSYNLCTLFHFIEKTVEGTAAGITSVLAACSVLLPLLATTGYIFTQHWFSLLLAVTVSGLLEAYTAQLDNAFIPLVFYSLLCL
ncbi:hypothetical protein C3L33_22221, partial [Rhododendron williamsianum]